jgi:hypothetical protein
VSQALNPDFSAKPQETGLSFIHSFFSKSHFSIACFTVGISFNSRFVSILLFIPIGLTQKQNKKKNIKNAKTKFIKIPARIMIDCCQAGLFHIL